MSYTALYRKFRPGNFDEVKGQEPVVTTLKNQIKADRIGHAYLFCGTRGTGKTSVAKIMARAVNCENPLDGNPCNECETCKAIAREASVNVVEMDAASNNGVDDIRQIKEQVLYPPTSGRYRVFIIDEVHMLSNQAFNALLKTLEEPPEYVIFILATTEVHKIPVTVLSRCQRYDFKRISISMITSTLYELCKNEGIKIEKRALEYIAKLADGAMRDALSLLDECVAFHIDEEISYDAVLEILGTSDNEEFERLFTAINDKDMLGAFEIIEDLVVGGREISRFVNDFLWYLRNLLIIKAGDDAYKIIDASMESIERMTEIAAGVSKESLNRYIRVLSDLYNRLRYSMQKRVLLELAVIKLLTPVMEESKEAILDRLSRVEKLTDGIIGGEVGLKAASPRKGVTQKDSEDKEQEKVVTLEKAGYDELMLLKKEWSKIIGGLAGGSSALFKDTMVEAFNDKEITIIFFNKTSFALASKEEKIKELKEFIAIQYKKDFEINVILKENKENVNIKYITKEILENNIKFDIDIE